jgi:hypothetical protein
MPAKRRKVLSEHDASQDEGSASQQLQQQQQQHGLASLRQIAPDDSVTKSYCIQNT